MAEPIKILLAEDDITMGVLLKQNLESKNFEVALCRNGKEAMELFTNDRFNICVLDVMMPMKDGFTLAREIRNLNKQVPILFLTAKSMEKDKLEGFSIGADDYITKPFSIKEVVMRIHAVLKRSGSTEIIKDKRTIFKIGKFTFRYTERALVFDNEVKTLSLKEAGLLLMLATNINSFVDRSTIMITVWGNDDYFVAKSMDVYLTRLRKLLKKDSSIEIQNLYGTGFRLIVKPSIISS